MKKNFLLATMALFMTLFATSCSQEEIISDNDSKGGGTVSVAVNIPVNNPVTRAVPNIPEGYKLRCILQLVKSDDNSNIADGRYVQEVTAGSEKVTFTFNAPSDTYKCLFWADYVKEDVDADNIYTTTDLKAIGYTANARSEMFNGDVADAFYACSLEPVTGNGALASITLKRPFTKITFKDGQSAYTDYTKITIKDLPAPTGFNVMNGETAGYAGKDAYTDSKISSSELTVENGKWFSAYLFASSNKENLGTDNDIVFELKKADNTSSGELKLNGASITLTENVEVEATVEPKKDGDTSIDVIFPDGMVDPNTLAVGDYILKDGTFSKEYKNNAIAIVFALKNDKIEDNSTYATPNNPKAVAYAMALCTATRAKTGKTPPTEANIETNNVWKDGDYNGFTYSPTIINAINQEDNDNTVYQHYEVLINDYAKNKGVNTLSDWYIPSAVQAREICKLVFGFGTKDKFIKADNNAVKEAYAYICSNVTIAEEKKAHYGTALNYGKETGTTSKDATTWIISSSFDGTNPFAVSVSASNTSAITEVKQATITNWKTENVECNVSIRPILTVFDGILKATDSAQ